MSTAEREIFTELFWKIRNLKYVPNAAEMDTLKACEAEAYNRAGARALVFGGASLGVFTLLGMTRTRKLASYGLSICNAAGGAYYGAKSTSTYCLECLVKLDTPIGGELAVIMARRCPDSALVNQSPWAEAIVQSRSESDSSSGEHSIQHHTTSMSVLHASSGPSRHPTFEICSIKCARWEAVDTG
mmetsp:Transcript_5890/g.10605  ORF Transcript_5890/g.10605 Transcript_5890/m.10605 type:complete len:186 (+) Transcript_5890:261-818(+)